MVEYIVGGNLIELDTKTEIELTISINDIRNPITINNSWSKTIDIPGTPNNNRIFEFVYINNVEVGYNPNLKRDCELRVDGIPIITGYQKISEIIEENGRITYKVIIYGNNTTIFEEMEDRLLSELNLDKYIHNYSLTEIRKTWETTKREGYYYPWSSYHEESWPYSSLKESGETFPFYPGFYIKTLVDKIFENYGYDYDSEFFNSDFFKSLYIPYTNTRYKEGYDISYIFEVCLQSYVSATPLFYYETLELDDPADLYSGRTMITPSGGVWEMVISGWTLTGDTTYFSEGWFEVYTRNPNSDDPTFKTKIYAEHLVNDGSDTDRFYFEFSYVFDDIGKGREVIIEPYGFAAGRGSEYFTGFEYKVYWNLKSNIYFNGMEVKPQDTLPSNLKQKDLFKTLINMFNLYIERDPSDYKRLRIEPFSNYYSLGSTIDWTDKVDEGSRKYKLMSELNNRSYIFTYKEDKDFLNNLYKEDTNKILGSNQLYSKNDFLSNDEKIELSCSPTTIQRVKGARRSLYLYWPVMRKKMTDDKTDVTDFDVETGWNWRILSQNVIDLSPVNYMTFDGITIKKFFTGSHIYNDEKSLWFDNKSSDIDYIHDGGTDIPNLFSLYWNDYLNLIRNQNSRLLTMDIFLDTNDVSKLRFFDKIFIKDSYYYLNNLVYSPTHNRSKVELLLIPSTDIREIYFSDLQVSGIYNISGEIFSASVRIDNLGNQENTYLGYFYIDLFNETTKEWDNVYDDSFSGFIPKNSKLTHRHILPLNQLGYHRIRFSGQGLYNFNKYVYCLENPISFESFRYVAPQGLYTGSPISILFKIKCTDNLYSSSLYGVITSSSGEYKSWDYDINGIETIEIEKIFTLEVGTNTFLLTGDYENSLSVVASTPTHNLVKGIWTFNPSNPNTSQQSDSLTANWQVTNTGVLTASGLTITYYGYESLESDLPVYGPITYTNQSVSGRTSKIFSHTFKNLPDSVGSNIYSPHLLYIKVRLTGSGYNIWDDPATEGYYPIYVQPCEDSWGLSSQSITNPVTGDTTNVTNSFVLHVNGCKDVWSIMYQIKTTFYSDNGSSAYLTRYKWIPATSAGGNVVMSETFLPPNNWSEGTKLVKVEMVDPLGYLSDLYTTSYTYYNSISDIGYVSSILHSPGQFYTIQCDLVAHNSGTGGGYAYATYDFRKPDNSVLGQFTGQTYLFSPGQTRTLSIATDIPSCLNGTYKCYVKLHKQDGSVIHSAFKTHVVDGYSTININGNRIDFSGLGDKVISMSIKFETNIYVDEYCGYLASGSSNIGYKRDGSSVNVVSSSCYKSNGSDSDYNQSLVTLTNINSGTTFTINSDVDTIRDQCTDIGGWAKATITGLSKTSGVGGLCIGSSIYVDIGNSIY